MPRKRKTDSGPRLTPRQLQILTRIRDYQRNRGYSPTMQELADELDITKVTVFEHVEALIAKNLLKRAAHKARSLELTSEVQFPDERPTMIPIAGRIAAGVPIEAIENADSVDLEDLFTTRHERFILEVEGESMIDEHIRPGDFVVVEKRSNPRNGDTVVALLADGEATLKSFYKESNRIRLQPANPKFKPIYTKEVDIQGVVIGVIRRY